jgi:hypothetical protein
MEVIVPEAICMPLYRMSNDPFRALRERGHIKEKAKMADWLLLNEAAAWVPRGTTMPRSQVMCERHCVVFA